MRWLILVVLILVAGATGWHLLERDQPPRTVDAIAGNPEQFERPSIGVVEPGEHARPRPQKARDLVPPTRSALRAQAKAVVAAGRELLIGSYRSEPVSAGWAMRMEQKLTEQSQSPEFASLGANPLNFAAKCRTSTCHITADFPSRSAADDWAMLYVTNGDTGLSNTVYDCLVNPDGSVHVDIYGRPGT